MRKMKTLMSTNMKERTKTRTKVRIGLRIVRTAVLAAMLMATSANYTVFAAGTQTELVAEKTDNVDADTASSKTPCAEEDCNGIYENGFCSTGAKNHYQEAPDSNGDGYYEISNGGQLYWFQYNKVYWLYNDDGPRECNAVLTADITVNENVLVNGKLSDKASDFREWNGIGAVSRPYAGHFDGRNHTISGLYYNDAETMAVRGLFSHVGYGGTISNVGVVDSYFCSWAYAGGIAGQIGFDENDKSRMDEGKPITVTNCYYAGMIEGGSTLGGVVGASKNYGTTPTISDCYNTGVVKGSGSGIGGVLGAGSGRVTGCYNRGTIEGTDYVGGVVGHNYSGTVENCYNTAAITGNDSVGGVTGYSGNGQVIASYNTGTVKGIGVEAFDMYRGDVGGVVGTAYDNSSVTDCYNIGDVTGNYPGGVIGEKYRKAVLSGSYYRANCATNLSGTKKWGVGRDDYHYEVKDEEGFVTAADAAQFASGEMAYRMNGNTSEGDLTWYQNIGTDTSPKFTGKTIYYGYATCKEDAEKVYTNDKVDGDSRPDHTYTSEITKEATTTDTGVKTYTCTVCGHTKTEVIPVKKPSTGDDSTSGTGNTPNPGNGTTPGTGNTSNPGNGTTPGTGNTPNPGDGTTPGTGNTPNPGDGTTSGTGNTPTSGDTSKDAQATGETEKNLPQGTRSTLTKAEKMITVANTDKGDVEGADFSTLCLKAVGKSKSVKLTWKKVKGADSYIIYGARCGKSLKKIETINKASTTSYTHKKLKKGKFYQYVVVACKNVEGESYAIATSKSVHAVTAGSKYGNLVKVSVKKSKISLKKGGKKTIKASLKIAKGRKMKNHTAKFRYESSNPEVATVSKKGVVKGEEKGKAYIYVYAQNGMYRKITVKVK